MKQHLLRLLSFCVATTLTVTSIPTYAYEKDAKGNSIEEIEYDEGIEYQSSDDETFSHKTGVEAELGSHYEVTIPKVIVLDGAEKKAGYYVKVEGDIAGDETVYVIPDETFLLYSKNKPEQDAFVIQDKLEWTCNDFDENAAGIVYSDTITAGRWSGTFWFNISLGKGSVLGDVILPEDVDIDDDYRLLLNKLSENPGLYDDEGNLIAPYDELVKNYGFNPGYNNPTTDTPTTGTGYVGGGTGNAGSAGSTSGGAGGSGSGSGSSGGYSGASGGHGGVTGGTYTTSLGTPGTYSPSYIIKHYYPGTKYVSLPDTVTHIGSGAFADTDIEYVYIPSSVTSIGDYAFGNTKISYGTIPRSVKYVGKNVYAGTPTKYTVYGGKVTYPIVADLDNNDKVGITLEKGARYQITALYNFYNDVTNESTIKSSDTSIVKFVPDCYLDAISCGTAIISGTYFTKDGRQKYAEIEVTVVDGPGSSSGSSHSGNTPGSGSGSTSEETQKYAVLVHDWALLMPGMTRTVPVKNDRGGNLISVRSSKESVAKIVNGEVVGVDAGSADIIAEYDDNTEYRYSTTVRRYEYRVEYSLEQPDGTYKVVDTKFFTSLTNTATPDVPAYDGYVSPEKQTIHLTNGFDDSLTYKYKLKKVTSYSINYSLNGGVLSNNKTSYTDTESFTLPTPVREGYTFLGWTGSNGTTPQTTVTIAKGSSGNKSYVANWEERKVSYDVIHYKERLDGTFEIADEETCVSTVLTVTPDTKEYEGFNAPEKQTVNLTYGKRGKVTYKYTRKTYTVSVNKTDGIESVSGAGTYKYGEDVKVGYILQDGYTFSHWAGNMQASNFKMPAENVDMTVYAEFDYSAIRNSLMAKIATTEPATDTTWLGMNCKLYDLDGDSVAETAVLSGTQTGIANKTKNSANNCINAPYIECKNILFENVTPKSLAYLFCDCQSLEYIDAASLDVSKISDFTSAFANCSNLKYIDVANWDMEHATTISNIFYGCSKISKLNVAAWNTKRVTKFNYAFYNASGLSDIDFSGFAALQTDTSYDYMFAGSDIVDLNLSDFNLHGGRIAHMFAGCSQLTNIKFPEEFAMKNYGIYAPGAFTDCVALKEVDLSGLTLSVYPDQTCHLDEMFANCTALEIVKFGTIGINTKNFNADSMFENCVSLKKIEEKTLRVNVPDYKYTSAKKMFKNCESIETLDFSNVKIRNRDFGLTSAFENCKSLKEIKMPFFILSTNDTFDMPQCFKNCSNLETIEFAGNKEAFVLDCKEAFMNCSKLQSIINFEIKIVKTRQGTRNYTLCVDAFKGTSLNPNRYYKFTNK